MHDDPPGYVLRLTTYKNRVMNSCLDQVMEMTDRISTDREEMIKSIQTEEGMKYKTIKILNCLCIVYRQ